MENTDEDFSVSALETLEQQYRLENQLLEAVSLGQADHALRLLQLLPFPAEKLQDAKHFCIATDALLRKAAERGGVHPFQLDQTSRLHTLQIVQQQEQRALHCFFLGMPGNYCGLVQQFSAGKYALPIKKAMAYINTNLSAELGLQEVAQVLNISTSYLSALFKKETGQTITDYIRNRRISHAKMLLENTAWQIQAIAQHCGFLDVHYFSRIFKQSVGMTPSNYRNSQKYG